MNYTREIGKLIAHRKRYYPVMVWLLGLHTGVRTENLPREITENDMMLTGLELLDIEYLDPEAFVVKKAFGDIRNFYYIGGYPFTAKGAAYMEEEGRRRRLLRVKIIFAGCMVLLLAGALIMKITGLWGI